MGQRLIIELTENSEVKASLYFHWGAYFTSSLDMLCALSKRVIEAEKLQKDCYLHILEFIESIGGGVRGTSEDLEAARKLFQDHIFNTNPDRNWGLMTFTKEGMLSFNIWGEGFAIIELDTHKVHNGVSYEGEDFLDFDYEQCGCGVIMSANSGKIHKDGIICSVDAFEFKCEDYVVLSDFMGFNPDLIRNI